jgi:signal peptidase I
VAKSKQASDSEPKSSKGTSATEQAEETPIEFLASLASVLVTGLFIITFVLQAFEIPSGSMEDTLLIGDHVFVNRVQFAPSGSLGKLLPYRTPHHDEVAVFVSPLQPGLFLVKRIIGIPGDHLRLRDGVVYRNGQKLDEPFTLHKPPYARSVYANNFPSVPPPDGESIPADWAMTQSQFVEGGELVVPPGHFFGMGDNRDNSFDSRFFGLIPQENLIGRPMFIYWSFDTPDGQYEHTALTDRIGFLVHTIVHFFDLTRWSRTFKVVR